MAVLLFASLDGMVLDRTAAARLAAIGVTHATIVRDATTVAVVVEGWRFDVGRSGVEAAEAVGGPDGRCRVLRQAHEASVLPEAWTNEEGSEARPRTGAGRKEEA